MITEVLRNTEVPQVNNDEFCKETDKNKARLQ